jgi:hypothetical protein
MDAISLTGSAPARFPRKREDHMSRYWFPAKRYGWGWGLPVTWQGWAVLAACDPDCQRRFLMSAKRIVGTFFYIRHRLVGAFRRHLLA